MKVAYRAYDRSGKEVSDVLEASSLHDAGEQLRRQGVFVLELAECAAGAARSAGQGEGGRFWGKTRRLREMSGFMRQLSVLVVTGTPMVDAIASLERQIAEGSWKAVVSDVRQRVEEGASLSDALAQHPGYFDAVVRSLVAAGESGGQLDEMLRRLSVLTRQQLKVRASITGAMVYPCLLMSVCVGVLIVMIGFVLPRFEGLFEALGSPLPPTTRLLMELSHLLRSYWWGVLGGLAALCAGAKLWLGSEVGRRALHRAAVTAPPIGKLTRSFATARVARVLGVLLEGRVPLVEALALTREATGNLCYTDLIARAEDEVTKGGSVSGVFEKSPLVNRSVTEALRSGERSGQMGPVLLNVAEFLEEDNEVVLRSLSSIVEPLILIVLGLVVGFVAISMFLPLFDLATAGQEGVHG